ncbi:MAG: ABC transporter permease [Thermoguttaceae bacterium]
MIRLKHLSAPAPDHALGWAVLVIALVLSGSLLDDRLASLVGNTCALVAGTLAIAIPLGTLAAVAIARTDMPGRRLAAAALVAMLLVPVYLQAAAWQAGFGLQGWVTLNWSLGVWLSGMPAAVWIHGLAAIPWVALIVAAGLRMVEPELEEQALLDASPARVFRHVTLPACYRPLAVAAVWVAVTTSTEMAVTDLFAVRTFAEEIYTQAATGPWIADGGFVGPPGFVPSLLATLGLIVAGLLLLLSVASDRRPPIRRRRLVFALGRGRRPAAMAMAGLLLIVIGVPLVNLAAKGGIVVAQTSGGLVRRWSLGKFVELVALSPVNYGEEFGWTILIGTTAATLAAAAAVLLAWLACRGPLARTLVWLLTAAALATPGPVIGLAVIRFLDRPELPWLGFLYSQSILAPCLAQSIRALPPAVLIAWFAFRSIPPAVLEAARIDGAGPWGQLLRIALPMRRSTIGAAWLVAMIVASGDLAATVLTVPPGVTTLSIRIFTLLHYGVEDVVAGISLASAAAFAGLTLLLARSARRCLGEN